MDSAPAILPLPADAVAQIKSSIAVTSLNAVAIELLKNSLDAHSIKIELTVDYCRGNCVVEDDGLGIPPLEFKENGGLGKLHHTSKYNNPSVTYGNRGTFIASVAALALVSITSHHHLHQSHNTLIINRSQVIARHTPAPLHQHIHTHKHGTRVIVRDLFGNMPVRVKQRIEASSRLSGGGREWEELRKLVTGLILAWPSAVLLIVRDAVSGQKLHLRGPKPSSPSGNIRSEAKLIAHVCSTLSQAMFISSPDQSKWVLTRASTPRIRIQGAISQEPAPTKAAQFLSLGIEPLNIQYGHSALFDEINQLFENSSFGNEDELSDLDGVETRKKYDDRRLKTDNFTNKELRGSRKGVNRWPMFYIQIEFLDLVSQVQLGATYDLVEDSKGSLSSVLQLLKAMVLEFLKSYNFRPGIAQTSHLSYNGKSESSRNVSEDECRTEQVDQSKPQYLKHFQPGRIGSPFDMWSRVKSGRPKPPTTIPEQFCQPKHQASIGETESLGSSTHIPTINVVSSSTSDQNSPALKSDNPIISRSGKVTRLPFGSLTPVTPRTESALLMGDYGLSVLEPNQKIGKEEFLKWTNPVTGKVSLVNCRTGLDNQSAQIDSLKSRISFSFMPDSRVNFPIADGIALSEDTEVGAGSTKWINDILRKWNNPVYRPTETSIYQVSSNNLRSESQLLLHGRQNNYSPLDITRAFQETSPGLDGRISREALRQADVISQVDNKFILIKISVNAVYTEDENKSAAQETLVIVDQHAADERCRVEELLEELCNRPTRDEGTTADASPQSGVLTTPLAKPISFVMPEREIQLLQTHAQHFANWGILYDVLHTGLKTDQQQEHKVIVRSLPPSIIERCTAVPRLLVELLRSEVWKHSEGQSLDTVGIETGSTNNSLKHPWLRKIHSCPRALLELLNSRACRSKSNILSNTLVSGLTNSGAIMFNDVLSNAQCKALVSRLAECAFPFQCAHGRPSMIPLLSLDSFTQEVTSNERVGLGHEAHFIAALKRWKYGVAGITDGTYNYGL